MSSPNHKAQLSTICDWIVEHYPSFDRSDQRWQNSIRHNLSLQKCFVKLPHSPDTVTTHSKSCFWTI
ncbi:winged helix DNA-binding domain-containing protein, partial [Neocallimastix californiae]